MIKKVNKYDKKFFSGAFRLIMLISISVFFIFISSQLVQAEEHSISNIIFNPTLDVSFFGSYTLQSTITGSPTSVTAEIEGINQDDEDDWQYYADGTANSSSTTKTMSDENVDGDWIATTVRPDSVYPQIYFAPSSITWSNTPTDINIRRSNYHLLHFSNPFTSEASSTFFIELYAEPVSTVNSADLSVYLVKNNKNISFFNSDWRSSLDVSLVGSIGKNTAFDHVHATDKSEHYVIKLTANEDGTFSSKNLDISGDFWVVLYANSPNTARGWNLKYHSSSLCNNTNGWYIGNQSGWSTNTQAGCPDMHIHFARRGTPSDGVRARITANYSGSDSIVETKELFFDPLPNLAPNPTSFISPLPEAIYDGDSVTVSWTPATDPNNDSITYNIYYYNDSATTTIATATSTTSIVWDVGDVNDGAYGLKGEACDAALCTGFFLSDTITLNKADPLYSLSDFSISSDNNNENYAKADDIITLLFTASGDVSSTLNVELYSGGGAVHNPISLNHSDNNWTVEYIVTTEDLDGSIDYIITADNLDFEYSSTTPILIDVTAPSPVETSPMAGTYSSITTISLSATASDYIRYTRDNTNPSCSIGTLYSGVIDIDSSETIRAVACDTAGNMSAVASFIYLISASQAGSVFIPPSKPQIIQKPVFSDGGLIFDVENFYQIAVSERADFIGTSWEDYNDTYTYKVSNKTLYIKFRSKDGGESQVYEIKGSVKEPEKNQTWFFLRNLKYGMTGDDVRQLQKYLNNHGFILAKLGPGSSGNETKTFGFLTRAALIAFQKANSIKPAVGYFGPITREFVNRSK